MKAAEIFKGEIDRCLPILSTDEWALTKARTDVIADLEPHEAFSSIVDVMLLASRQDDEYAFSSCCWLTLQLAEKANTTEIPQDMTNTLKNLYKHSSKFGSNGIDEVKKVALWFRLSNTI